MIANQRKGDCRGFRVFCTCGYRRRPCTDSNRSFSKSFLVSTPSKIHSWTKLQIVYCLVGDEERVLLNCNEHKNRELVASSFLIYQLKKDIKYSTTLASFAFLNKQKYWEMQPRIWLVFKVSFLPLF